MLEITKAISRVVGGRLQVQIDLKGDLPGHPFRGNQWSGGNTDSSGNFPSSGGSIEDPNVSVLMERYREMFGGIDEKTFTLEERDAAIRKNVENAIAVARGRKAEPLSDRDIEILKIHEQIVGYVDRGYRKINQKLRKDIPLSLEEKETTDRLKSLEQDMDVIMYRGIPGLEKSAKKMEIGSELESKGLSSTSMSVATAMAFTKTREEPTVMEIRVRRGTPLPTAYLSHETEVILADKSKFRVRGFSRAKHPFSKTGFVKVIQMEQIT